MGGMNDVFPILPGCAFAQFKSKEAADRCIAAAQDEAEVICMNNT